MAAGTCTYIICIKIYAIGRQILSSASLSGGLIIGCFFLFTGSLTYILRGELITRSIFLFTGRWTYLLRRGGGGLIRGAGVGLIRGS